MQKTLKQYTYTTRISISQCISFRLQLVKHDPILSVLRTPKWTIKHEKHAFARNHRLLLCQKAKKQRDVDGFCCWWVVVLEEVRWCCWWCRCLPIKRLPKQGTTAKAYTNTRTSHKRTHARISILQQHIRSVCCGHDWKKPVRPVQWGACVILKIQFFTVLFQCFFLINIKYKQTL